VRDTIPRAVVGEQLQALGVAAGEQLVVHTSYKAVGPIEGGPAGLVDALRDVIGPDGTLVMPSMSEDEDAPFDTRTTPCRGMGVVADTFWRMPGVVRSEHEASFAAVGPLARAITAPHPLEPPHGADSPVGRAAALGGRVLLLGVGHDANTTVHLAEALADVPYRIAHQCTILEDGVPTRVTVRETDSCCARFAQLDEWLGARQRRGAVGHGEARLVRASDVVHAAVRVLATEPFAFLHPRGECEECDEAWASVIV
jgi:aminoglycoside 3-N-acetyltransferase